MMKMVSCRVSLCTMLSIRDLNVRCHVPLHMEAAVVKITAVLNLQLQAQLNWDIDQ